MSLIELAGVNHSYPDQSRSITVVRDINLTIEPGEFVGLSGPSGSGKSTLLNILGLIMQAESGSQIFSGVDIRSASDATLRKLRRSQIGFVFQHFCLLAGLSALENVVIAALLAGATPAAAREHATALLTKVGLGNRLQHQPALLSGGERQRVGFCRALIHKPSLILADEPTGSLDIQAADSILELLEDAAKAGIAIVMASHSERALKACNRVISLERAPEPS